MRRTAKTESAQAKERIQALVREIVIIRDGGCLLRNSPEFGPCNGYRADGELILQANHLVTRGKNIGYGEPRLIVCLCQGHHKGYHSQRSEAYKAKIRELIGKERSKLWARAEADGKIYPMSAWDWTKVEIALINHLKEIKQKR